MRYTIIKMFLIGSILTLVPQVSLATTLSASDMIGLTGTAADEQLGTTVATGDFNGDGYQDIVSGAANSTAPYITITYGTSDLLEPLTVSTDNTVIITGSSSNTADNFGTSLATGDTNDDGYDDILVGATGDTTGGATAGAVWLIYGKSTEFTSQAVNSDSANVIFNGNPEESLGTAVAMGDLNNDGYDEMLLGGSTGNGVGTTYVLYGTAVAFSNSQAGMAAHGQLQGESMLDAFGSSLAIGDLNGDDFGDLVAGAPGNDNGGVDAGAVYIIYGASADIVAGPTTISTPVLTGEAAGDAAGTVLAVSSTSIDGDAYNDILIGAPGNDDGATGGGAMYLVPGSETDYSDTTSLSSFTEFAGDTESAAFPTSLATQDLNQDGYSDMVIGSNPISNTKGIVYIVQGSAGVIDTNIASAPQIIGESDSDALGSSVAAGDLNNDGFSEILTGAKGYTGGASSGAVYVGYLYIDADGDGAVSSAGLLSAIDTSFSVDCDDTSASIIEGLTLYADADGDTLGDPNTSISACAATAGYVENANDTDDTIPNNGVEIDGDGVDNDGDSVIDEHNDITDNGEHPYYGSLSPTDEISVSENIISVVGTDDGMITVTYEDGSVYDYPVYDSTTSSDTSVEQYQNSGYSIVLHKKGKKVYLVNLYNGDIADKVTIKKAGFTKADMLLKDLRSNNKDEVIVTGKKKTKVTLAIVKVNVTAATLKKTDSETITNNKVVVTKTKATTKKIKLRSAKNKTLVTFKVTKKYKLILAS